MNEDACLRALLVRRSNQRPRAYVIEELTENSFDGVDIALFSAGGSISKKFGPLAAEKGCFVVDNSSAFRMARRAFRWSSLR